MTKPKHLYAAIAASQSAVSYALKSGKMDPFSEAFAKMAVAASFLFNTPINEVHDLYGGPGLGCEDVQDEEEGAMKRGAQLEAAE